MKSSDFFPPRSGPLASLTRQVALLRQEPEELSKKRRVRFRPGHDDLDDLTWAELTSTEGHKFALVRHRHSPTSGTEIVISEHSDSPGKDLTQVLSLLGISPEELLWSHPDAQESAPTGAAHEGSAVRQSHISTPSLEDSRLRMSAALISRFKKERYLQSLTEDDFRDRVIRPLFHRLGLSDGRDLCGPTEEGKDAVFLAPDLLGGNDVVVVQTKRGNLNLAGKARDNLITAITQLRTAAETPVFFPATKEKRLASKVILCASGKINAAARKHIVNEIKTTQLRFSDADDLIPQIDAKYPELWLDINADVIPYMRSLRRALEDASDNVAISELMPGSQAAATDAMFVDLYLWRNVLKTRRHEGKIERIPDFVELPITGILSKPERLVLILGEAGSGKSTAIKRLAYVLAGRALSADAGPVVPVLLRASDLVADRSVSVLDAGLAQTQRIAGSAKPAFTNEDLQNGRVVISIDGLDEVTTDDDRKRLLSAVLAFHALYSKCLVCITSREYAFLTNLDELGHFARYRVQDFSLRQAQQLIEKLERKGGLPTAQSKELIRRLDDIHGMELNPLLVTIFAATTEYSRQDVPANITELFKKFTEIMLGRWDATKGFGHQFHAPLKDFILCKIAFEMHLNRSTSLDVNEFQARIENELQNRGHQADANELLDEILTRSGLLRILDGRVEFRHLLLQEFFAGRGIPSEDLLESFIFDDWWRRAVVFYFGDRPSSSAGLSRIRSIIHTHGPSERFTAAGTLGLALQACYLLPVVDKVDGIVEVMEHFADVKDSVVDEIAGRHRFPLAGFLTYYLMGRDSVAISILENHADAILQRWNVTSISSDISEARQFWLIAGLLESGKVTGAESLVRRFKPKDPKLLLAIHLGCFLIQHLRVSTDDQRKGAKRICGKLEPITAGLRRQVFDEFKTQLLEMRRGELTAVSEDPETAKVS